jgi:hypothetical protein
MDAALCPLDMAAADRSNFLEMVVDVIALPGMWKYEDCATEATSNSAATDLPTTVVVAALGHRMTATDVMCRSPANTIKVKTQYQLHEYIASIKRAGRVTCTQQKGRMQSTIFLVNYPKDLIQAYLQAGLLLRIVHATYKRYESLLYKAWQKAFDHGHWEGGLGYEIVSHHAKELSLLQQ